MADHDGHTTNVGPVTVGIDTDRIRNFGADLGDGDRLCDEVDRLRAENAALAAALEDIAGMVQPNGTGRWISDADCAGFGPLCWNRYQTRPGEWCPVCVAEVAWCAWKMGVLG